jgi:hypothetical protein
VLLLITQALPQLERHRHPNLGRLIVPGHYPRLGETLEHGFNVAADNGCYSGKRDLFLLTSVLFVGGCGFVAVTGVASRCVGRAENLGKSGEVWSPDPCVVI